MATSPSYQPTTTTSLAQDQLHRLQMVSERLKSRGGEGLHLGAVRDFVLKGPQQQQQQPPPSSSSSSSEDTVMEDDNEPEGRESEEVMRVLLNMCESPKYSLSKPPDSRARSGSFTAPPPPPPQSSSSSPTDMNRNYYQHQQQQQQQQQTNSRRRSNSENSLQNFPPLPPSERRHVSHSTQTRGDASIHLKHHRHPPSLSSSSSSGSTRHAPSSTSSGSVASSETESGSSGTESNKSRRGLDTPSYQTYKPGLGTLGSWGTSATSRAAQLDHHQRYLAESPYTTQLPPPTFPLQQQQQPQQQHQQQQQQQPPPSRPEDNNPTSNNMLIDPPSTTTSPPLSALPTLFNDVTDDWRTPLLFPALPPPPPPSRLKSSASSGGEEVMIDDGVADIMERFRFSYEAEEEALIQDTIEVDRANLAERERRRSEGVLVGMEGVEVSGAAVGEGGVFSPVFGSPQLFSPELVQQQQQQQQEQEQEQQQEEEAEAPTPLPPHLQSEKPKHGANILSQFTATPTSYSKLLSKLDDLLLALDRDTRILYASPPAAVSAFLGVTIPNPSDPGPRKRGRKPKIPKPDSQPHLFENTNNKNGNDEEDPAGGGGGGVVGRLFTDWLHVQDRPTLLNAVQKGFDEGRGYTIYVRVLDRGRLLASKEEDEEEEEEGDAGGYFLLELIGRPVLDPSLGGGGRVFMLQIGRTYQTRGSMAADALWSTRVENLKLRGRLENQKGGSGGGGGMPNGVDSGMEGCGVGFAVNGILQPSTPISTSSSSSASPTFPTTFVNPTEDYQQQQQQQQEPLTSRLHLSFPSESSATPIEIIKAHHAKLTSLFANTIKSSSSSSGYLNLHVSPPTDPPPPPPPFIDSSSLFVGGGGVEDAETAGVLLKPKKKKVKSPAADIFCHQCGVKASPEWRKGPNGPKTLCNACGLAFAKKARKEARMAVEEAL
ncbi:blue light receptor [Chytridiales sp. JEL 0842]|nr:blue light receptor [Chytridiales sp. JEL 0842]